MHLLALQEVARNDDHDHDHDETDTGALVSAKATAMGFLFVASLLTGTLPFVLAHLLGWTATNPSRRSSRIISLLLSLGGGVLLATTFLHLLPEVRETVDQLQHNGQLPATPFALSELLMCAGFFAIYGVSELVHAYILRHNRAVKLKVECALPRCPNGTVVDTVSKDAEAVPVHTEKHDHTEQHDGPSGMHHHSHLHLPDSTCDNDTTSMASAFRGLMIVLALSVHEMFEGMALGLESSSVQVWLFFGAIASHKLVLAFCVGIELMVAKTTRWLAIVYIVTFAVVSPLGIGIGMLVSQNSESQILGVVLQALATGTLVYVVFFEVLKKGGLGLLQFAAVVIGFAIMFGLQQLNGHEHGEHGHSHGNHIVPDADDSHAGHSHSDELRQRINILKQAGQAFAQSMHPNSPVDEYDK